MPGFVQIMEIETSHIDEVRTLMEKTEAENADIFVSSRGLFTADRDRPDHYVAIIEFDSYDEAMKQSSHPAIAEFSKRLTALLGGPPRFYNLDVVRVMDH